MQKNKKNKSLYIPTYVRGTAKTLAFVSDKWAAKFALNLFDKPIKFPMPDREKQMDTFSTQYYMVLPQTDKEICVYEWGNGSKKALLIHGWNGRGTQLCMIAKALIEKDYTIYSYDAPGHGKAKNSRSLMTDFIDAAFELQKKVGDFDVVIGHSLGGMSTINAISRGLKTQKAIVISAGDIIQDIIDDFVVQLGLPKKVGKTMKHLFEKKYNNQVEDYTVHKQAQKIDIPVMVIHDKHDKDVPYTAGENIAKNLRNGHWHLTEHLGHRKILRDEKIIKKIVTFSMDK